jgi:hypothetical protein
VFVGIIKSVDTYFQLAKRAESHRICSLQFSQISKKIQVELTLHRDQRLTAENMMNIIKTDIKNMQDIAPLIDDDVINVYNAKYRKYKRVKKPNFVNGLTEVKVNPHNNENEYEYASRQGSREASPSNNQNNGFFNPSGQKDDDNHSVDPVQPTIIPTNMTDVNRIITNNIEQSIRKTPSLSFQGNNIPALPYASVASVPVSVPIQQQPNQQLDNLQLLQLLNQLQQQGIGSGILGNQPVQSRSQVQSHAPSPAQPNVPPPNAPSPAPVDVIVPIDVEINNIVGPSVSPAGSVRSSASVPLGTIQTDNSGNQVVNT